VLSDFLSRMGISVRVASDGIEGIDQYTQDSFDLVIADIAMPRMDGMELLRG
jgi:CheY-like chemotaxis protein